MHNLIVFCSDEHSCEYLGCYGNDIVLTPNLDKLAKQGVLFRNAYSNSPICVPICATMATGKYVYQHKYWDITSSYDGAVKSWRHLLQENNVDCLSFGKLHYKKDMATKQGFQQEINPMYVFGKCWGESLLRQQKTMLSDGGEIAKDTGSGDSDYTKFDAKTTDDAINFINNYDGDKPFVIFISLLAPHYPLIAPEQFFNLYENVDISESNGDSDEFMQHKSLNFIHSFWNYEEFFNEESKVLAKRAYYGLCSYMDYNVGKVLTALEHNNLKDTCNIIYVSDHSESLGNHGMLGKLTMYEHSVGIPIIMAGPDIENRVVDTPVSLVDLYPTILGLLGIETDKNEDLPGENLNIIADNDKTRIVVSKYHDGGCLSGFYMLRWDCWKYVFYVGAEPQLFNLDIDPMENINFAKSAKYADILKYADMELRKICNPELIAEQALQAQRDKYEKWGGVDKLMEKKVFNHIPID